MAMFGNLIRVSKERLENYKENSNELEKLVISKDFYSAPFYIDIDKSWEAVHFILCGESLFVPKVAKSSSSELTSVIFNSQLIDEEQDLGYGPAAYNTPNQVEIITKKLNALNLKDLESRFDGNALNKAEIYPEIWNESESKKYAFDNLKSVIKFFNEATKNNEAIISYIN